MSMAMPATKGAGLTIAGQKISWDAILVAGAGVLGVILLYRAGQPSTAIGSSTPTDTSAGGLSTLSDLPTLPADPTRPGGPAGAGAIISAVGASSFVSTASGSVAPKPGPTTTAPLNNYSAAYAASAGPRPASVSSISLGVASSLSGVPILGSILGRVAATPVDAGASFNPVVPRSHGTQAL